ELERWNAEQGYNLRKEAAPGGVTGAACRAPAAQAWHGFCVTRRELLKVSHRSFQPGTECCRAFAYSARQGGTCANGCIDTSWLGGRLAQSSLSRQLSAARVRHCHLYARSRDGRQSPECRCAGPDRCHQRSGPKLRLSACREMANRTRRRRVLRRGRAVAECQLMRSGEHPARI